MPFTLVRAAGEEACFLAGYLPAQERLIVLDGQLRAYAHALPGSLLAYQQAIMRGDEATANALLPQLSPPLRSKLAPLLEQLGRLEAALAVACDPDYRLPLALKLGKLPLAMQLAAQLDSTAGWQQLGDRAWAAGEARIAQQAFERAQDWPSLLLLHSGGGERGARKDCEGLAAVGKGSQEAGQLNVALTAYLAAGKPVEAISVLLAGQRYPEAAALARRAAPQLVPSIVAEWNALLARQKHPLANLLEAKVATVGTVGSGAGVIPPPSVSFQTPLPPSNVPIPPAPLTSFQAYDSFNDQLSMEVNTTGTGSVRAEDVDELIAMKNDEAAVMRLETHAEEEDGGDGDHEEVKEQEPEYDQSLLSNKANTTALDGVEDDWA